jgi:gamma-glutamylcyclotransferase (GGCT)/AIG2-like uncharacterized protein YtfP
MSVTWFKDRGGALAGRQFPGRGWARTVEVNVNLRPTQPTFLFAYGSLLAGSRSLLAEHAAGPDGGHTGAPPRPCRLRNHRRVWNVAMDNRTTLAGYKYYRDPEDGRRPEVFVAFLNIVPRQGSAVNGVVLEVSEDDLAVLDERERNYSRRAVTAEIDLSLDGPVWTYVGTGDARERYATAARLGHAVVSRGYLDEVLEGFRTAGVEALAEFEATTDPPSCPVVDLERVDVARGSAG